MTKQHWAAAQTVTKMEHIVRRDIEKMDHGAFLPTFARQWKIDGREYRKECPLIGGYVFFLTDTSDWAGIPDIHGVYQVLSNPDGSAKTVSESEMARMVVAHAAGDYNRIDPAKYTKYCRPNVRKRSSRKPRPGNRIKRRYA